MRTEPWRPADPLPLPLEPKVRLAVDGAPGPAPRLGELATQTVGRVLDLVGGGRPSLRPFNDLCASLPAGKMVRVRDRLVHVDQAGRGEPVLLLHGFGCSSHSWRLVIPALARRYRVIAPDLNGHGWTQRPRDASAYTLEGQEAMLLGLLERLGVERFHLVGHSYGGGLAIWLAARHPQRVRSLALLAAALPAYSQQQRQAWARFRGLNWLMVHFFVLSRPAVRRALDLCFHDRRLVTPELVDAYRTRLLVEGVEDAYYGLLAPVDMTAPDVDHATLRVPTLVVWGDDDKVASLAEAELHTRTMAQAEFVVLPSCGHAAMEEKPQELLSHLLPFLARHRRRWLKRLRNVVRSASGGRGQAPPLHRRGNALTPA